MAHFQLLAEEQVATKVFNRDYKTHTLCGNKDHGQETLPGVRR